MHFRAFFTFSRSCASNPDEAQNYLSNYLEEEGFCSHGRWGAGPADYFTIGGRWNGELINAKIDPKLLSCFYNTLKNFHGEFFDPENNPDIKKISKEILGIDYYADRKKFPNAAIVDQQIYDTFLKEHEGIYEDHEHFWDLEDECVSKDFIDNKWIVVVDYHN